MTYDSKPYIIVSKKGTLIEAKRDDDKIARKCFILQRHSFNDMDNYDFGDDYNDCDGDSPNKHLEQTCNAMQ